MEITSLCPFRVATVLWEAQHDQWSLSVCVKATFVLVHEGEAVVAEPQDPMVTDERHWDGHPMASVHGPGDLVPLKPRVDVLLVGHAHAPGARPVQALAATLRVGDFDKTLLVTGDQPWVRRGAGVEVGPPALFTRMPLRYERAAMSADNPVGIDPAALPLEGHLARPNVEATERDQAPGFGPLAPSWPSRRNLLSERALFWAYAVMTAGRSPGPAPAGFDFGFFNAAPPDQQIELLRAGTPIFLENLHPSHARLETCLPPIRPQAFRVDPRSGRATDIALRCDTLWIDSDRGVATVAWRGLIDVQGADAAGIGRVVVAADPTGKRIRWERIDRALRSGESLDEAGPDAIDPLGVRYDALRSPPPPPPADPGPATATPLPSGPPRPGAGPPRPAPRPASSPAPAPREPYGDRTMTERLMSRREALPFRRPPAAGAAVTKPAAPPPPAPSAPAAPSAPPPLPARRPALHEVPEDKTAEAVDNASADNNAPKWLAKTQDLPIERYAEIAAEIATKQEDRDAVLQAAGLTAERWFKLDAAWTEAIARESEAGGSALLSAFDAAYMTAQSRLRRPIGVPEYAAIVVAVERGEVGAALATLDLRLSDLVRLQRLWTKKAADDPGLAALLEREVEAARKNRGESKR